MRLEGSSLGGEGEGLKSRSRRWGQGECSREDEGGVGLGAEEPTDDPRTPFFLLVRTFRVSEDVRRTVEGELEVLPPLMVVALVERSREQRTLPRLSSF